MRTVDIRPLPRWARSLRYKPNHPPIFPEGEATQDEIDLARALFQELDPDSRAWYSTAGIFKAPPITETSKC